MRSHVEYIYICIFLANHNLINIFNSRAERNLSFKYFFLLGIRLEIETHHRCERHRVSFGTVLGKQKVQHR